MSPYVWFIVVLCVGLAAFIIFVLPKLIRREAIESQERFVIEWQETVRANPIPLYQARYAEEAAKLQRMKEKYQRRYGKVAIEQPPERCPEPR